MSLLVESALSCQAFDFLFAQARSRIPTKNSMIYISKRPPVSHSSMRQQSSGTLLIEVRSVSEPSSKLVAPRIHSLTKSDISVSKTNSAKRSASVDVSGRKLVPPILKTVYQCPSGASSGTPPTVLYIRPGSWLLLQLVPKDPALPRKEHLLSQPARRVRRFMWGARRWATRRWATYLGVPAP